MNWKKEGENFVVAGFCTISTKFCFMRFHMHVVVVKCRQRNVQKGLMHHEQNDYFWLGFVDTMLDSFLSRYETLSCMITHSIIMWISALEVNAAQILCFLEIAPKSRFLCVNRSPIRYGFRAGAKATRHSVTMTLV